jgi:hypothetical protein
MEVIIANDKNVWAGVFATLVHTRLTSSYEYDVSYVAMQSTNISSNFKIVLNILTAGVRFRFQLTTFVTDTVRSMLEYWQSIDAHRVQLVSIGLTQTNSQLIPRWRLDAAIIIPV